MDAPHASPASAGRTGVPAPLDGEIILPKGRARPASSPAGEQTPKNLVKTPWIGNLLIGTTFAGLVGLGAAGGFYFWDRARALDATVASLHQVQRDLVVLKGGVEGLRGNAETARQDDTIRSLKKSVDSLKAELDNARASSATATAQLAAKLDKADRDPSAKLADISARLDKLDSPAARLGDITARLDRIERQVSSPTPTGSIATPARPAVPAPVSAQQASSPVAADKPAPKPAQLGNYVLRDVYDGIALVEGRGGGIREVTPGEFLPGAGEVRAIERRGRNWIVVTSRGIIDDSTF